MAGRTGKGTDEKEDVMMPDAIEMQPVPASPDSALRSEIKAALNRHSAENGSGTPDFILADYLLACLAAYDEAVRSREAWYGRPVDSIHFQPGD